jgi:DsbC/DsbD-like thiol-disulfide interchange protein
MSFHRLLFRVLPVLAILLHLPLMAQSTTVRDQNVEARLISSHSTIKAGEPFTIGLQFNIDPTWHTYWSNPGETGLPTSLKLDLPSGFTADELQFPVPKKFITDYGFDVREAGYGYETSVVHPMTITPPADQLPEGGKKVEQPVAPSLKTGDIVEWDKQQAEVMIPDIGSAGWTKNVARIRYTTGP